MAVNSDNTRIAFFGGAFNESVVSGIVGLYRDGYDIVVCDHDPRESVALKAAGIPFTSNRLEAVTGRNLVITSLATGNDVEDLYFGENALLELLSPGSRALDLSFVPPTLAREVHAMAAVSDIEFVDSPILNLGDSEEPIAFVGGARASQDYVAPVLPYFARNIIQHSEPGEGQFAAMISVISFAGSLMGAVESVALASAAQFPWESTLNTLASTAGGSRALAAYAPLVHDGNYGGRIKVRDFLLALDVALTGAEALDVTVPLTETAYQLFDLLSIVGGDELNIQALALLYSDEQTCADHGLDWELAEAQFGYGVGDDDDDDDDDDVGPGFSYGDFFEGGPGPNRGPYPSPGFFSKN